MGRRLISLLVSSALAAAVGFAPNAALGQDAPDPYLVTSETLGPVTVGMKVEDAVKALGPGWSYRGMVEDNDPTCGHISFDNIWSGTLPFFMAQGGVVTRIEIGSGAIYTDKGIHVGSTEKQVLEAYGKDVRSEPHQYIGPPAKYLTVWTKDAPAAGGTPAATARGIQFVTDENGIVTSINAGDPSILYVEGCA